MSNGRMWFGNEQYMTWVPEFAPGSSVGVQRYTESIKFSNGGGNRVRSAAGQMVYELDYPARDATGYSPWGFSNDGLDAFNRFASGDYGDGLLYISDEMTHDMNVIPRAWAAPGLIEQGWPNIYSVRPTFADTVQNQFRLPRREATWAVPANSTNFRPKRESQQLVIPIPEDSYLTFGYTGATTGNAVVRMEKYTRFGKYLGYQDVRPLSRTKSARTSEIVTGADAAYVKVYITADGVGRGTVTIASMMGQIYVANGSTPIYPSPNLLPGVNTWINGGSIVRVQGDHIDGRGSTGLIFADEALSEEYVMKDGHLKGLSTTLEEVGAWR